MKLYDDYRDVRDHFEILAFHDASAKTVAEIDAKLRERNVIADRWGGRNLPFPVLVDDTRSTIDGWGIRAYPTIVLIDPEGKLVKRGSERMLAEKLEEIRAGGTPAGR